LHELARGRIAADEVAALTARCEAHVEGCASCTEFLQTAQEITCRELVEFLNEYVDGEMEEERRALFDRHLAICEDCRGYLDGYRRSMALSVEALRDEPVLPAPPDDLVRAILAARRRG